jgi:hypothetical protein
MEKVAAPDRAALYRRMEVAFLVHFVRLLTTGIAWRRSRLSARPSPPVAARLYRAYRRLDCKTNCGEKQAEVIAAIKCRAAKRG